MNDEHAAGERTAEFGGYLSSLGAWSFAVGTSLGWGSFVITTNLYLSAAGPLGSSLGMLAGMVIMLLIGRNYHYMMNRYPNSGGAYSYASNVLGNDYGFLTAWFLVLTYGAIFWANATSLPLFAQFFFGKAFRFGRMYTLFGYDVYFGEALLSLAAIVCVGFLCMKCKRLSARIMIGMVLFFVAGISICFAVAMVTKDSGLHAFEPEFIPEKGVLPQILFISCISPWAFIGFESISHSTEEFLFPRRKAFRILALAVIATTLLYVFVTLLSITIIPEEYGTWLDYINDLNHLEGIKGLPPFYAAKHYLGDFGIYLLMFSLFSLIATSLIGNTVALSRLLYALARDKIVHQSLASVNRFQLPEKIILLIVLVSIGIPFLGRTAIGWIVDVTTLGATFVYGIVSASTFKEAQKHGDRLEKWTGIAGLFLMVLFGLLLLLPHLEISGSMAAESHFLFTIWAVLGCMFFHHILSKDSSQRFGKSPFVWFSLLFLILYMSLVWLGEATKVATNDAKIAVHGFYQGEASKADYEMGEKAFLEREFSIIHRSSMENSVVAFGMFLLALGIMLHNYSIMNKRALEKQQELDVIRDISNRDPLTGVKSKHAYAEQEHLLNVMISGGRIKEFSVVVCDVNGLKKVNDTLGHKAGDEYIRSASTLICECFKHSPVFRTGGDEFVVVLTGHDFINRNKNLDKLNEISVANRDRGGVVVAAGLADFLPEKDRDLSSVFERADAIMYAKKKALKGMSS